MSEREIIAYAITHAPKGVKGGPYEAKSGPPGEECDSLRDACRWPTTEADAHECAVMYLEDHLSWCGDARVIRIVRARPSEDANTERLRVIGKNLRGLLVDIGVASREDIGAGVALQIQEINRLLPVDDRVPVPEVGTMPSEASAVEVLRELAVYPGNDGDLARIQARARRVLASAGPDPMPVVRAALAWVDSRDSADRGRETSALYRSVDAYRKAGGK